MRTKSFVLAAVLLAVCASARHVGAQEQRGPSTAKEREETLRLVRALEADPFRKGADDVRRQLLVWLAEVPDITVTVCPDYLGPLFESEKNYAPELFFQMTLSSAAFIIEHPEQALDEVAVSKAGVEGTLRAYEAILNAKPKAAWPFLDQLIRKRDDGTLEAYVRELAATKCKSK